MKKLSALLLFMSCATTNIYGQITHDETVTIQPSAYGPKLILNDVNTANKVPIEFRSNSIIKWELGARNASEQYDLGLWRYFNSSYSPVMWFNHDNGNVGIGTKTPNSKLEIESSGSIYTDEASLTIKDVSNRGTMVLESVTDKPADFVFKNDNRLSWVMSTRASSEDYALRFYPSQSGDYWVSPTMSLLTDGNVGIGTTIPDSKLTVKGKIHAEEVKVDLSVPGPDYVFKEGYDLRTLEETQDYIKEHGHLPNIPSAKEMEENGVELGVMNMKLLEKIEELTLHVIELKEESSNQQKKLIVKDFLMKQLMEKSKLQEERIKKIEEIIKYK